MSTLTNTSAAGKRRSAASTPFRDLAAYRNLPERLCITLSGGRSSAYQAAHVIVANGGLKPNWRIVFDNTGFERSETLDFVFAFEKHFGVSIDIVEFASAEPTKVRVVGHDSLSRRGEPFIDLFSTPLVRRDGTFGLRPLPNPVQRVCSATLKVKTSHRFLRQHLGWPNAYHSIVGYRADEQDRFERRMKQEARYQGASCPEGGWSLCPMYQAGVTAEHVLAFWEAMPFDLGIESWEGNCDFCFMKAAWKIKAQMRTLPERVQPWIDMEETVRDRNSRFRKDRASVKDLFAEVMAGDMHALPQDPNLVCEDCVGDLVIAPEGSAEPGLFFVPDGYCEGVFA